MFVRPSMNSVPGGPSYRFVVACVCVHSVHRAPVCVCSSAPLFVFAPVCSCVCALECNCLCVRAPVRRCVCFLVYKDMWMKKCVFDSKYIGHG